MYEDEITAVVNYFPGLTYRWLLEGIKPDLQRDIAMDKLGEHIAAMSEHDRFKMITYLKDRD